MIPTTTNVGQKSRPKHHDITHAATAPRRFATPIIPKSNRPTGSEDKNDDHHDSLLDGGAVTVSLVE